MQRGYLYIKKEHFGKSVNRCYREEDDAEMPWKFYFLLCPLLSNVI